MIKINNNLESGLLRGLAIILVITSACIFSSIAQACLNSNDFNFNLLRGEMPQIIQSQVASILRDDSLAGSRWLGFHGTSNEAATSILESGYNPNLVQDKTAQLGSGLYTTTNFNAAIDYATGGSAANNSASREPAILMVIAKGISGDGIVSPQANRLGYLVDSAGNPIVIKNVENSPYVEDYNAIYAPLHIEVSPYNAGVPVDEVATRTRLTDQLKINPRAFQKDGVTIEFRRIDLSILGDAEEIAKYGYIYKPKGVQPGQYNPNTQKYFPDESFK